jgi:hypothetical protein
MELHHKHSKENAIFLMNKCTLDTEESMEKYGSVENGNREVRFLKKLETQ